MRVRTLGFLFGEAWRNVLRNGLMSLASISTVAVSLCIAASMAICAANLDHVASTLESQLEVKVFLAPGLTEEARQALIQQVTAMDGVQEVRFVSREEALQRLRDRFGEDSILLDAVGDSNPLPDSLEIRATGLQAVKLVALRVGELEGVEEVLFHREVADKLSRITRGLRIVGVLVVSLLLVGMLLIIYNTIRLTVFARRREVAIMKLVGATDWFIRLPFFLEGVLLGTVGAGLAALVIRSGYVWVAASVRGSLPFLPLLPPYPLVNYATALLLCLGAVVGGLGSSWSLRRYLEV